MSKCQHYVICICIPFRVLIVLNRQDPHFCFVIGVVISMSSFASLSRRVMGFFWFPIHKKVNSCLASYRMRATTTNQPTDRATNELTRPDPDWQRTGSGPELRRNGRFYVQQKVFFFCQKWVLTKKDTQKFLKRLIFIWKKETFFLWTTFFRSWAKYR